MDRSQFATWDETHSTALRQWQDKYWQTADQPKGFNWDWKEQNRCQSNGVWLFFHPTFWQAGDNRQGCWVGCNSGFPCCVSFIFVALVFVKKGWWHYTGWRAAGLRWFSLHFEGNQTRPQAGKCQTKELRRHAKYKHIMHVSVQYILYKRTEQWLLLQYFWTSMKSLRSTGCFSLTQSLRGQKL